MSDRPRLLLVDDEPDIVQSFGAFLTMELPGTDIVTAQDGLEALAILDREPVDLVVTDYKMPRMNGLELVALVHQRWPRSGSVLITAFPDAQVAIDAINRGHVRQFFIKPVLPDDLAPAVRRLLAEHYEARMRDAASKVRP